MSTSFEQRLEGELEQFIRDGVYKRLNYLDSPQGPRVRMEGRGVQLFDSVEGDHFAILGMPLIALLGALRDRGLIAA